MSTPDKPDHARGWRYVEKLLAEEDAESLEKRSKDEIRNELRQGGTASTPDWSADELIATAKARAAKKATPTVAGIPAAPTAIAPPARPIAPVVPIRRRWHPLWLVAAAVVGGVLLYGVMERPDVVAHPRPNRPLAEAERDVAEAHCALKAWAECKAHLDEAAKLDPAGESEPRVQKARRDAALGMAAPDAAPRSLDP